MPYRLVRGTTGFFVENKDTGRRYSEHGMTKQKAEAQMRVLMAAASSEKPSKGDYFLTRSRNSAMPVRERI